MPLVSENIKLESPSHKPDLCTCCMKFWINCSGTDQKNKYSSGQPKLMLQFSSVDIAKKIYSRWKETLFNESILHMQTYYRSSDTIRKLCDAFVVFHMEQSLYTFLAIYSRRTKVTQWKEWPHHESGQGKVYQYRPSKPCSLLR